MKLQRLRELALDAIEQCDLAKNKDAHIGNVLAAQIVIGDFNRYACPANILPFLESYEELLGALKDAKSVIGSINGGRSSRIVTDDGKVMYTQTEEWVAWSRDEILPLAVKAITNAEKLNHE